MSERIPTIPIEETGGRLTVDGTALAENYREIAARVAPAQCAAVLKADAYGVGLEPAAATFWRAGARVFFVALPIEGRRLRTALPDATIYVLNGLFEGSEPVFGTHDLRPVLGSVEEIARWEAFCAAQGEALPAAVHVDTGMNRLGLAPAEAIGLADRRNEVGFTLALLLSHLACADEPLHPLTARQLEDFQAIAALFPGVPASLANSAGALGDRALHFDLVRPGIALYGGRARADQLPLRPVVTLELRIAQIRTVHEGEAVGYGAAERVRRLSRVAVLSAGYADGLPRFAGGSDLKRGACVLVAGRRCPLVGRISMDLLAVDITDVPEDDVHAGDFVTALGGGIGVDDWAVHGGTIGYEVLTSLGRRYHRVWRED
ncbi:alanine racemase [Ancylobacter sp. 6x-1]|uniref:Alanine racemase n=1 Tax=Ancylobacter crimeensis TaxID=2579147 RepID=A0ABT0D638_9HYPH|nr:alanine racemase [Ancylobacter crimeensis]MCK0195410.1 alanine racemase [Ancylobacter crimeensis]